MSGGGAALGGLWEQGWLLQSVGEGGLVQGGCAGQPPRVPHCSRRLQQGCGWVGMGEGGSSGVGLSSSPPCLLTPAGLWVLSPRRQHTSALRITAARGYEDCARHLLLRGAAVDAVVGGRAPLHDSAAAPHPNCARLLLAFGANPNVLSADGSAPLHLCTAPHSLRYGGHLHGGWPGWGSSA